MSSSYIDILTIFQKPKNSTKTILEFDKILNNYGIFIGVTLERKSTYLYYLEDYQEQEFDPEDIVNAEETLNKIANWPTAGWLEYYIKGCSILVSFEVVDDFSLGGINLSAFEQGYNYQKKLLDELAYYIHKYYQSRRTIKYEDIYGNWDVEDEITRVRNNIFEGDYEIDLR